MFHLLSMHQAEAAAAGMASGNAKGLTLASGWTEVLAAARHLLAAIAAPAAGGHAAAGALWDVQDGAALAWLRASLTIQGTQQVGVRLKQDPQMQ
jgi:hypothetical protein